MCVVSRELDEPSPNFIVVYDLQSGTLFKKWKPGCDTVALAISSVDGCVVSGLADTRILVWDLVTGMLVLLTSPLFFFSFLTSPALKVSIRSNPLNLIADIRKLSLVMVSVVGATLCTY